MGTFIRHIIGTDERLILLARLHWIYLLAGTFWMLALLGMGIGLDGLLWTYFGASIPGSGRYVLGIFSLGPSTPLLTILFGGCGVMIFALHAIKMLATEIALTNNRLIYKTGLIFVEVEEIDIVEIRAEHVHHGLLGRILGYGKIKLDSRFVGDIWLPSVRKPYRLIKAMHTLRTRLSDPMDEVHERPMRTFHKAPQE